MSNRRAFFLVRRGFLSLLLAAVLVLPARPAHALFGIDDAIFNALGAMELPVKIASNIANSVRVSVEIYFDTIIEAVKADGKFKQAKAEDQIRAFLALQENQAAQLIKNTPSPLRTTCRTATAAKRLTQDNARAQADLNAMSSMSAASIMNMRWPSGKAVVTVGSLTTGGGFKYKDEKNEKGEPAPNGNESVSVIHNAGVACERGYAASDDELETCKQLGVAKEKAGRYKAIDRSADMLLGGVSFDNKTHERAAMDYCYNLIMNREMEIPDTTTGLKSVDHAKKERFMYGEFTAHNLARYICDRAVAIRKSGTGLYAYNPGASVKTNTGSDFYAVFPYIGQTPVAKDPNQAGNWPDENGLSYATQWQYVPGQSPSNLQRQLRLRAQFMDTSMISSQSTDIGPVLYHYLQAKSASTAQSFQRLRYMETELLLEAALLARKVNKRGH